MKDIVKHLNAAYIELITARDLIYKRYGELMETAIYNDKDLETFGTVQLLKEIIDENIMPQWENDVLGITNDIINE